MKLSDRIMADRGACSYGQAWFRYLINLGVGEEIEIGFYEAVPLLIEARSKFRNPEFRRYINWIERQLREEL